MQIFYKNSKKNGNSEDYFLKVANILLFCAVFGFGCNLKSLVFSDLKYLNFVIT